jgi:riboflavin kinase/FMN adenylyltransferase
MRIIEWPQFLEDPSPFGEKSSAITVGVFDGIHRGHKALIERIVAYNGSAIPVVVTFRQSDYKKARSADREYPGEILSYRQKLAAFESLGVSVTVIIEFSESFRHMSGTDFLRILQEHGKMCFLAVGSNFRCGYQLDTDALLMQKINKQMNIPTDIVQVLTEGAVTISSSQIRNAICGGELKTAAAMLGYPFTVDLVGVPPFPQAISAGNGVAGNSVAYDISGQGRILPPPGRYSVFLLGKKGEGSVKEPSEIMVEGGKIIINSVSTDACLESVEFCACGK